MVDNNLTINYIKSPTVIVKKGTKEKYTVVFLKGNEVLYNSVITGGEEASLSAIYHIKDLRIDIYKNEELVHQDYFDLTDKKVLIGFESSSIGDTLAWIGVIEKFREQNKCEVVVSTFHNYLFENMYPLIEFVLPGTTVYNLYKIYELGVFKEDHKMPEKIKDGISLQEVAISQLNVDTYEEIVPKLKVIENKPTELPYVCIAIHSTAQCKYWNKIGGWQAVVDLLTENGYKVYLLSKEGRDYMGNKAPIGVEWIKGSLTEIASIIKGADFLVGISSGLSWISWAVGTPVVLISSFSKPNLEFTTDCYRVYVGGPNSGYYDDTTFDGGYWNWNPIKKCVSKQDWDNFEPISIEVVLKYVKGAINKEKPKKIDTNKKVIIQEDLTKLVSLSYKENEHRLYIIPKLSFKDVRIEIDDNFITESYNFEDFDADMKYYIEHDKFIWENSIVEIYINDKLIQKTKLIEKEIYMTRQRKHISL